MWQVPRIAPDVFLSHLFLTETPRGTFSEPRFTDLSVIQKHLLSTYGEQGLV